MATRPTRFTNFLAVAFGLLLGPASAHAADPIDLFGQKDGKEQKQTDDAESTPRQNESDESNSDRESEEGASDDSSSIEIERGATSGESSDGFVPGRAPGHVELEFERRGDAILVPAEVSGQRVYFVLDTGASLVSITPEVARAAGILPPDDAPALTLQTANGTTRSPVGLVDRLRLGRRTHDNVTYALCSGCGSGTYRGKPIAGLLGLNVLRRYETDIDTKEGVVTLSRNANFDQRLHDIEPWVQARNFQLASRGDEPENAGVRFEVVNRAPRRIGSAVFDIYCPGGERANDPIRVSLEAGEQTTAEAVVENLACRRPEVELAEASWF